MLRSFAIAAVATVILGVGACQAQVWEYLSPSQTGGKEGSDAVRVVSHQFVASIGLDSEADKWRMMVSVRPVGDAQYARFIVERQGQLVARKLEKNDFAVSPLPNPERVVIAFWLREPELELLMSGDGLVIEVGSHAHSFPLSGSRKEISRLISTLQPHREALADDRAHAIVQARSDCDQQAAHPDDELNDAPGVDWSDLQADIAMDVCRYAMVNSEGLEKTRMTYQLGRALDKAGDPDAFDVLFVAGENYGYPIALNHLAILYRDGDYVEASPILAERFFKRASDHGNVPARYNLARLRLKGAYTLAKTREAYGLLIDAAVAGYPMAQEFFGKEILAGNVDGASTDLAVIVLTKASAAGQGGASLLLAEMYRGGNGVMVSPTDYLKYLRLASEQGNEAAKQELGLN